MGQDGAVGERDDAAQSVAELRRRAEELAVLNDLARRLAALHDTREVLDEVARQARRLLGVDVAYIMLLRADRLRIEVVDGAMGSAMRGIELESGQGLGGRVLATGRPLSSERYLADTGFPHEEGTDAAALSEQLGGILGVPLVAGDDTLGVLLAADRRPRAFGDRDVELLAGLAAHAALALRTADLFDRERAAAAELRSANTALHAVNESRQRASNLRDVLNDVVIRGAGLAAVVAALESVGRAGRWRSATTTAGPWPASRLAEGGLVVPVDLPSGHGGDLVAAPTDAADEEVLRLLRIGATTVAVLMASERSVAEAELRTRGEFVHALLSSDTDEASLLPQGPGHGRRPPRRHDRGRRRRRAGGERGGCRVRVPPGGRAERVVGRPCRPGRRPPPRRHRAGPGDRHSAEWPGRRQPHDGIGRCRGRAARGAVGPRGGPADGGPARRPRPCRVRRRQRRAGPVPLAVQPLGPRRARDLHPRDGRARSSATTPSTSATSRRPSRPTCSRPATTPGPARPSTSTPTRSTSGSTGSPRSSARGGRNRAAHSSSRWRCACTDSWPTARLNTWGRVAGRSRDPDDSSIGRAGRRTSSP